MDCYQRDHRIMYQETRERTPGVSTLINGGMLDAAYDWLYEQRKEHSHNNSIWYLRTNWEKIRPALIDSLSKGEYRFSPVQSHRINHEYISSWDAQDAIVLKALALTLQPLLTPEEYPHCTHLKGGGGIHAAVRRVSQDIKNALHIQKSDAYHYYESIDHEILLALLSEKIQCGILLNLVRLYCERVEIRDGHYYHFSKGIPMGCPLSPLIAALYLKPLDDALSPYGCYVSALWTIGALWSKPNGCYATSLK